LCKKIEIFLRKYGNKKRLIRTVGDLRRKQISAEGSNFRKKVKEFRIRKRRRKGQSKRTTKRTGIPICGIFCPSRQLIN
jgi:hypothetical protein